MVEIANSYDFQVHSFNELFLKLPVSHESWIFQAYRNFLCQSYRELRKFTNSTLTCSDILNINNFWILFALLDFIEAIFLMK